MDRGPLRTERTCGARQRSERAIADLARAEQSPKRFYSTSAQIRLERNANLTKCAQDTGNRDINDLIKRSILVKDAAGGRSRGYSLRMDLRD
jgi:Fic family protein